LTAGLERGIRRMLKKRNKISRILLFFLAVLFLMPVLVYGAEEVDSPHRMIRENQVVYGDFWAASERISNYGKVLGDFMVSGKEIYNEGIIQGDIISFSSTGSFGGIVMGNVRSAASELYLRGDINKNATVTGDYVFQHKNSVIDGNAYVFANNLDLQGNIQGNLRIFAKKAIIGGKVKGNVYVRTGELIIEQGALIEGNLIYVTEKELSIPSENVLGQIEHHIPRTRNLGKLTSDVREGMKVIQLIKKGLFLLAYLIVGSITIAFFKEPYEKAAALINERPWYSIGVGIVILIGIPIIAVLTFFTLIGIPISFLMMAAYGILIYLGKIPVGIWLGSKLLRGQKSSILCFLIGIILIEALGLVPYIGWWSSKIALALGVGATLMMLKRYYKKEYIDL
jgi:cytoskeletal protein CcmA (bactofilin family)